MTLKLLDEAVFDHELFRELEFELVCVQLVIRRLKWFLTAKLVNLITILVSFYYVELPKVKAVKRLFHLILLRLLGYFCRVYG